MEETIEASQFFFESRRTAMELNPEDAVDFVLNHSHPKELVHSFSEESLYFFLYTIGIDEAASIIALASDRQWEYFLDIEAWEKDSLDYFNATNLLTLMMDANPERFAKWCFYENFHFIELYFFRNIDIKIVDDDIDPTDFGDGFFTNDGIFYFDFINYETPFKKEQLFLEKRNAMLNDMLLLFSKMDHFRYQGLMMEVVGVIPAELEEELFRLRNVRLREKGFLPFHEAIGLYQPLKVGDIKIRGRKVVKKGRTSYSEYPIPHFSSDILGDDNLFVGAIQDVKDDSILQQLQVEFVALCNLLISADNRKIKSSYDLKKVVGKASGLLNIGIEFMMETDLGKNYNTAGDIVRNWTFDSIFRIGYGRIFSLAQKATNWYNNSWFNNQRLKLYFWGERWQGVLGGLLLKKPMFFSNSGADNVYDEFRRYCEINQSEKILNYVIAVDKMFSCFNLDLTNCEYSNFINTENLLLTLWALHSLDLEYDERGKCRHQITLEPFRLFFEGLWEESCHGRIQIKDSKKTDFLVWIAKKMSISTNKLPNALSLFFEGLFKKLQYGLSQVNSKELDPRYIDLFIIK